MTNLRLAGAVQHPQETLVTGPCMPDEGRVADPQEPGLTFCGEPPGVSRRRQLSPLSGPVHPCGPGTDGGEIVRRDGAGDARGCHCGGG
jgi:hypothetical protein